MSSERVVTGPAGETYFVNEETPEERASRMAEAYSAARSQVRLLPGFRRSLRRLRPARL